MRGSNIYALYDSQGNKVDEGTNRYLADKYFVTQGAITHDAIRGYRLLGEYYVSCLSPHPQKPYHYVLYNSDGGATLYATSKQIGKLLGVDYHTVNWAARENKKIKGYTVVRR